MKFIIGIDIGTTHTKAVVATTATQIIAEIKKSYRVHAAESSHHEQDPEDIFQTVLEALKEAVAVIPDKDAIACVCFSAAMHSMMAIDVAGSPLTNLYTWADTRSNEQAQRLKASGNATKIYAATGVPIHAMSPLCKIAWVKDNLPDVFASAHKFISGKEYVFYRLFNQFIVDHSIASATGMFDLAEGQWNHAALAFAGIDAVKLSEPVAITHAVHDMREEYREYMGLTSLVPFVIGSSDGVLANIGSGALLPGEAALTIGTSGAVRTITTSRIADSQQRLFNYLVEPGDGNKSGTYLVGGAINNGGIILKWFIDVFTDGEDTLEEKIGQLSHQAAAVPPGSDGLIFLPYLYGERAPVWDAEARGMFIGIRANHTKAFFFRSMLEGIAFSLLEIIEALEDCGQPVQTIYASGGFIESPLWLQIITDILNKEIKVPRVADASALGAVFTGMRFLGLISEWREVKSFLHAPEAIAVTGISRDQYMRSYAVYKQLYRTFQPVLRSFNLAN